MSDNPPPPPPPQPFSPQPANPAPPTPPAPPPSSFASPAAPPSPFPAGPGGGFPVGPAGSVPLAAKRSGRAIAAMVLGISGVVLCFIVVPSILAIVFAALALKEIKRSAGMVSGRGMAIAGLVLGVVGVLAAIAFWAGVASSANTTSVFDLEVGDCVELPDADDDEVARLKAFECTEPHGAEVFATGDLGDGDDPYPGVNEVQAAIAAECVPKFERYVGIELARSELVDFIIYPTEDDWDRSQDYVCLALDPNRELSESIENSGR